MVQLIIALIMALISYFTAKKKGGASNTQAAMIAAAAGMGTYYVASETEWGKSAVQSIEGKLGLSDPTQDPANYDCTVAPDGTNVYTKKATTGTSGSVSTSGWDVLKTWGATGTAAVIGTTALSTSSSLQKYIPWALLGLGAFLILK